MAENKIPTSSALSIAEYIGPEALRSEIVSQLRSGDADDETIAFLADLFDPSSEAKYKINILYRKEGSETQRKKRRESIMRLAEIYRKMKKPDNFVNHAEMKTGLDAATIRRYRKEVMELAKTLDDLDTQRAEMVAEIRSSKGRSGVI